MLKNEASILHHAKPPEKFANRCFVPQHDSYTMEHPSTHLQIVIVT